jgi:2-C-methyl-D-erythritol 4-phosphate cytidylyltransferase
VNTGSRVWAVIPAAGTGSRFDGDKPKQYARIGLHTVLEHSAISLLGNEKINQLVVAVQPDDVQAQQLPVLQDKKVRFAKGGQQRADSVLHALEYLQEEAMPDDWVLVHDAARPCLSVNDLQNLLDTLIDDPVGGILAVPVTDTLKKVDEGNIVSTIDRSSIWQAQTPQMFRFGLLLAALQQALGKKMPVTDEASAVEATGYIAKIVHGSRRNIKITYPDDLALAAFYLREERPQQESES